MHRGPAEKFGPLSFYAFPGSWYRACALRVFLVLPAPGPPSYAPQGVEATQFPRGPVPEMQIPSGGELHGAGPTLFPALLDLSASTQGRPMAGLRGLIPCMVPF